MKSTFGEKVFWTIIALSSVGAAAYGYHRFKQIRPDLYQKGDASVSEAERAARIAEYQKKGDALSRAAASVTRAPRAGEVCVDGVIVMIARDGDKAEAKRVIENGQPVRCEAPH